MFTFLLEIWEPAGLVCGVVQLCEGRFLLPELLENLEPEPASNTSVQKPQRTDRRGGGRGICGQTSYGLACGPIGEALPIKPHSKFQYLPAGLHRNLTDVPWAVRFQPQPCS
ncbi:hypothetical protein EVAR_6987_1 [Eumeta japonica]|uniref:Uncharacterized protein n=1 Tax=Eumeta variegata TaxID=151549 RepID=A0A4C1TK31_EUMVA|nr:hypothetical protein EVAR_6987_1 [Eumeta japonica]